MSFLRTWLAKKRVWIPLALYVIYALFGFLMLPGILRGQIVQGVRQNLGRELLLERVRVNPIFLSLTLEGFDLKDHDGTSFLAFDRFHGDFQISSLVRWAATFRELRLDRPRIHMRLLPGGTLNFDDLIPRGGGETPRLVVGSFQIHDGSFRFTNLTSTVPDDATLAPIDLTLENFTTIPRKEGLYHIAATDPGRGAWEWNGDLTFDPLHSAGTLDIKGSRMRGLWQLIDHRVGFEIADGELGCHLEYAVDVRGDSLLARMRNSSLALTGLALREKGAGADLLKLDSLTVSGIEVAYPEQTAGIRRVLLAGAQVQAWLNPDTTLNWTAVLTPPPAPPPTAAPARRDSVAARPDTARTTAPAPAPWTLTLDELAVRDLGVAFEDRTIDPAFAVSLDPVNATIRNLNSKPGSVFDLASDVTIAGTGRFDVTGKVTAEPATADLAIQLTDLPLPIFQPYIEDRAKLQLVSGTLGVSGDVRYRDAKPQPDVTFKGRVQSRNFVSRDRIENEQFVAWKGIDVNAIDYAPSRVSVGAVRLDRPYVKFLIHRNRTTNLQDIFGLPTLDSTAVVPDPKPERGKKPKPPPQPKASEALASMQHSATAARPAVPVKIGTVEVVNASADFADLSLILPFVARIEQLGGTVKGLSSDSAARAVIALDGRLQPTGIAQVRGELNPLASDVFLDVDVVFRDFNMPTLTPYGGTFLGREIDKGKMSLDLGYQLQGRHLVGSNKILLDQLELGEKVESPEATRLPVGLAIAILKDREGKIDLDLPVEGDLDDPKFRIGKVIWDFITSLLTKVATAPFALLGGLFSGGGGDEDMGTVAFETGSSAVPADQQESLAKLAKALAERPQLRVEVRGLSDAAADAAAIRKAKFDQLATERIAGNPKRYGSGLGYSPRLLEDLCVERFGKDVYAVLADRNRVEAGALPPEDPAYRAGSTKVVVNNATLGTAIQDTLMSVQRADEAELLALANARAQEIKQQLVAQGVDEARIFVLDPQPGTAEDGRLRVALTLTD